MVLMLWGDSGGAESPSVFVIHFKNEMLSLIGSVVRVPQNWESQAHLIPMIALNYFSNILGG